MDKGQCNCNQNKNMVITCFGVADVGYISDKVGRMLMAGNHFQMSCMAMFASCNDEKINKLKKNNIMVIDGCNEDCGKRVMKARGIEDYSWLRLTDLGYEKSKTPCTNNTLEKAYNEALKMLN